jgi:SAM-dependent methyltransferase
VTDAGDEPLELRLSSWAMPTGSGDRWPRDYERGRPGWPSEVVDVPGLPPTATVLELGAGTGKLTRLLVRTFERVVAVEPAEPMRRLLAAFCPEAEALEGAAEEIPLEDGSVDGAFVAEAFHRFDHRQAVAELARVLRPGGALVLLWNLPAGPTEPSIAEAERFLAARAPGGRAELGYDPLDLNTIVYESGAWRAAFAGSPFEPLREARLPNPQTVDRDELVAFFASMGWLADLPDAERLTVLGELRSRLADAEYLRLWETHIHWARLTEPWARPYRNVLVP